MIVRSGAAVTGVVSDEVLLAGVGSGPFVPSSAMVTVLAIWVTPAGSGFTTVTAKVRDPEAPAARLPMVSVQVDPAFPFGEHTQPPLDAPALNELFAGTVSDSTTPVAPWLPLLAYDSVYATVPPGVVDAPPSVLVMLRSGAAVIGVVSLGIGIGYWRAGHAEWQTMIFTTLAFAQVGQALAVRSRHDSLFSIGVFSNRLLASLAVAVVVLQLAVLTWTPLQELFGTKPLAAFDFAVCAGVGVFVFVVLELEKWWMRY